jgi:hypothetical protein
VCSRDGSHKFLLAAAPVTGRGVAQVSVVPAGPDPSPTGASSPTTAANPTVTGTAYDIELELNVHGRERFSQLTYHLAKTADGAGDRHLAYVLDSLVVSAPDVRSVNASGRTRLGVRVPEQRAEELAREVRAAHFMSPVASQGRAAYARAGVREIGMTGADTAGAYLDLPAPLLATDPGITPPGILPLVRVHGQWLVDGLTAEWAVALVSACGRAPWRQGRSAESSRLSSSAAGAPLRSAFSPLSSPRPDPRRAASLLRPAR